MENQDSYQDSWATFSKFFEDKIKRAFSERGLNGVTQCVLENLDEWNSIPLNVAVTGFSGAGKSSFINTFLGLMADDKGAAEVDVKQCTKTPTPYNNPQYPNLKLWDLPGIGTPQFAREVYLQEVHFSRYDFFLILSESRFKDDDLWLSKEVHREGKHFYFVRTKVDTDISNFVKSQRNKRVNVSEKLEEIRSEIIQELEEGCVPSQTVFLIENYVPSNYDFNALLDKLVDDAPIDKKDAMALSFSVLTKAVIEAKRKALKGRIPIAASLSSAGSAAPIPGLGLAIDFALLLREAKLYRLQFGLNDESLQRFADILGVSIEDLKKSLDLKSTTITLTAKGIVVFCRKMAEKKAFESIPKYTIPILGSIISGGLAYWSTGRCLENLLEVMTNDAFKINQKLESFLAKGTPVN